MKHLRLVAAGLAIAVPSCAQSAFERLAPGGREVGLACAAVALSADRAGTLSNPACLAGMPGIVVTTTACPALFGIPEVRAIAASAGAGVPWGGIAASLSMLGTSGYRETVASFSCAYDGGSDWSAGVRINLYHLSIEGYGSTVVPVCDAGARVRCGETVSLGVLMTNIGSACVGKERETLPRSLECGASFAPPGLGAVICAAAVQQLLAPLDWRFGLSYAPCDCLVLRAGLSTEPALLCGGFGVAVSIVSVDYGVSHHWQLGLTHHVSVSLALN